nr:immunoglobulin light chain junction region [Macaca mulatta]
CQQYNRSPRTF